MKTIVCKRFKFAAAHWLESDNLSLEDQKEIFGKCTGLRENDPERRYPHGHTYELEVKIEGPVDDATGMVINFVDIKKIVNKFVIDKYDHKCLNMEVVPFNNGVVTTAENMANLIFRTLRLELVKIDSELNLVSVRVWEGPESWAEVKD